jgi:hypothetical protein
MNLIISVLIFLSLIATAKALQTIYESRRHLSFEEFEAVFYNRGDLTADEYSRITQHLGTCRQCQRELEDWVRNPKND